MRAAPQWAMPDPLDLAARKRRATVGTAAMAVGTVHGRRRRSVVVDPLWDHLQGVAERDVVLELSEVTLLSAAGLTVLLELQDRLRAVGARVVLAAASRPARRVLRVTGLDEQFVMAPTVEDAIEVVGPDVPAPPTLRLGANPRGGGAGGGRPGRARAADVAAGADPAGVRRG